MNCISARRASVTHYARVKAADKLNKRKRREDTEKSSE